jgi:hypothetical protein
MKILPVTAKLMKQWHNRTLPGFKFRVLTDQTGLNYISPHTRSVIQDLVLRGYKKYLPLCEELNLLRIIEYTPKFTEDGQPK